MTKIENKPIIKLSEIKQGPFVTYYRPHLHDAQGDKRKKKKKEKKSKQFCSPFQLQPILFGRLWRL